MDISRRTFLKSLAAASSIALAGGGLGLFENDTYYMRDGEILRNLDFPKWTEIVMADDCIIESCRFKNTQIIGHGVRCRLTTCIFIIEDESPPPISF